MKKEVLQGLNDQINFEFYSAYIYLALAINMEENKFKGYASWLRGHYHEELQHAEEFMEFIVKRGAVPELQDIKIEKFDVKDPLEVANIILDHERKVSQKIYELHDLAKKNDDYATEIFMHQFINEQIEEENTAQDIVDSFIFAGDSIAAKYSVDKELRG